MDARRTPQSVGTANREDGTGRTEECPKKAAKSTSECKAEKREPHEVDSLIGKGAASVERAHGRRAGDLQHPDGRGEISKELSQSMRSNRKQK